uniref:Putative secreted protein n=1 Tax=Ixodes ricinus TaxID=34613 RepID=A0A6B0U3R6_IXORI
MVALKWTLPATPAGAFHLSAAVVLSPPSVWVEAEHLVRGCEMAVFSNWPTSFSFSSKAFTRKPLNGVPEVDRVTTTTSPPLKSTLFWVRR